jgi:CRISPR/Cas system CSM-associated protein Csm4 (group 5 of RAMP superfamily)
LTQVPNDTLTGISHLPLVNEKYRIPNPEINKIKKNKKKFLKKFGGYIFMPLSLHRFYDKALWRK